MGSKNINRYLYISLIHCEVLIQTLSNKSQNKNSKEYHKTKQLNVKLSTHLYEEAQNYSKSFGYTNIQELIREAIREKIFDSKVKEEYIEKLLNDSNFKDTIGEDNSSKVTIFPK